MFRLASYAMVIVLVTGSAVFGGLLYLSEIISVMADPPLAAVQALPDGYLRTERVAPYQGPHPRLAGRPEETFEFPIALGEVGPIEPLFSGPLEQPFLCGENTITRRQPLVDNHEGHGVAVFAEDKEGKPIKEKVVGYSLHCSHPTSAEYYYNREGTRAFFPLDEADNDIATIEVDGKELPFIVRLETGTINRYLYIIAALRGSDEEIHQPNPDHWNKKFIYQFRGGVGIGKRQGKIRASDVLKRGFDILAQGYAMAYSSGTQTSVHYNLWLAEDTAARIKRQFVALYGEPLYTVGIGGSGGAIQQYVIAQNHPGLLDAAIALYSYPDMITQTIATLDCEPLEYYFDVVDADNTLWKTWEHRSLVQGFNAASDSQNRFTQLYGLARLLQGKLPNFGRGASECVQGWRGLTPLVHNPTFAHFRNGFAPEIAEQVHWTHWDNLRYFYGTNTTGYANSTWDNVGVQYGLSALKDGKITVDDFLHLNKNVGGWKSAHEFQPEKLWLLGGTVLPVELSFWSEHNQLLSHNGAPAQRSQGSIEAIEAAYRSGHVFVGHADIPIVDLRHYLDDELDMHHATASFAARQRMINGQGHADNQLIWMAHKDYDPTNEALHLIDRWMSRVRQQPERGIVGNKPADALDKCFDAAGDIIAEGAKVWDGDWNQRPAGPCMKAYPRNKTSREVAGAGISGDIFKCHLQSVASAITQGVYGSIDMRPYRHQLEQIFPQGVCDFPRGDMARPVDLMEQRHYADGRTGPALIAVPDRSAQTINENAANARSANESAAR